MALEAKRAAKLEKKLKTLLGGYQVNQIFIIRNQEGVFFLFQSRGQALMKALNDIYDQIDQTQVEAKTFDLLRQNEVLAIPKRIEVIELIQKKNSLCLILFQSFTEDVARQEERERELQRRYQELYEERDSLFEQQ